MEAIAIAEEIESLLKENVLYDGRRLRPSDIAILVAKRFHADKVIEELRRRGIRTLRSSNENVLCSKEAHELKSVLEAMYDPRDTRLVAAAQATRIFGDSLNDLLNNDAASAQARLLLENSAKSTRRAELSLLFRTYLPAPKPKSVYCNTEENAPSRIISTSWSFFISTQHH